ncbi:hypothetical protein HMPREF9628_00162 [Peptoanaerobacter stomatis]|uniref:Phage protein n=1 Tax=Peptoanaerobacter stomatis TaxID=796937 RepID=G9XBV4_9FIRM|nr:hypothetical protein [Peptoanaerobacter stomatis]EHL19441.1 hypothetical protein HMPREF9628_00162 [Peptoanaerobacter stomatis]
MKNTLIDLNNYLFEQIERLQDDELTEDELEKEIKKSKSIGELANTIINNASLALNTQKFFVENGITAKVNMPLLGVSDKDEV